MNRGSAVAGGTIARACLRALKLAGGQRRLAIVQRFGAGGSHKQKQQNQRRSLCLMVSLDSTTDCSSNAY